jgi:uncharacterized protein YndB with AHSA1/START domain
MSDELATFDDRLTMRHTRVFPHPIELVWEAVSEGQHLETWLLPVSRVEPRLGGAFVLTWGSPEGGGELVAELPSHVSREREEELTVLYRAHIAATCPQS